MRIIRALPSDLHAVMEMSARAAPSPGRPAIRCEIGQGRYNRFTLACLSFK